MDLTGVKKAGIIGAGVAGLSTAKLLGSIGVEYSVFELRPVLGGVWAMGYSNLRVQVQRELYEFPDWPLPEDGTEFTPATKMQSYLEDYAKNFGIWPNIRFNARVRNLQERDDPLPGWVVTYEQAEAFHQDEFDLVVICNGLYSNRPHLPQICGQNRFQGQVLHISSLATRDMLKDKKVAIVGFGKSATDAAAESAAIAAKTSILFREPHWPVPPRLAGVLPFKWAMLNRLTSALIPLYYRPTAVEQMMHSFGRPLVWFWWRLVELLLIVQNRLWSRFGTRLSLVPGKPVEIDTFGESTMLPRPEFYPLVRRGLIQAHCSDIAGFTPTGIDLKNGNHVEADIAVFATGWEIDYGFLSERLRSRFPVEEDGLYLYRQMLHPDVPDLVFIGNASTISSILTYNLQARWLVELISGSFQLPSSDEMRHEIEKMKNWKRKWMPYSRARAARLLLHMQHYHDELLQDFGASPLRKRGPFAPFKEVFAPYQPSDYRTIVSGKWKEIE